MKKLACAVVASFWVICGFLPVDAFAGELSNIPMEWKPTDTVSDLTPLDLTPFQNIKLTIAPLTDLRKNPTEIGRNIEKGEDKARLVTTKDNVANWLTERIGETMGQFGVNVVKSGGNAILEGDISSFYVVETGTYSGTVTIKWRLKSPGGAILWEGMTSDEAHRFGRSYKDENYFEALGNATMGAVHTLLQFDPFLRAVKKVE